MNQPPALVMAAPNGARRTKTDHPDLPVSIDEIARCAARCRDAGAGAIHAHVRDREGRHVLDAGLYSELTTAIAREAGPELVVQITTEAVGRYTPGQQSALVEAVRPRAVSVALREMAPEDGDMAHAARFYGFCNAENIAVQHILYDAVDFDRLIALQNAGDVPGGPLSVLFVLGRYSANQQSDPRELVPFVERLRTTAAPGITAMVCAFGNGEMPAIAAALAFGLNARVGFENAITGPDGQLLDDNAQSVARAAAIATTLARPLATPQQALAALGGKP